VKKFENQLLLGLEPMMGDEPKLGDVVPSAANFITLDLVDILIGELDPADCDNVGLAGGDCEYFLNFSFSFSRRGGDVRFCVVLGCGLMVGEVRGERGASSEEFELARLTIVAVSSETENVLDVDGEVVELLGLSGNMIPCEPPPRFASTRGEGRRCFECRESTRDTPLFPSCCV